MHISIWQQFSSNHSGNFQLVGFFVRKDSAEKAFKHLHNILRDVQVARQQRGLLEDYDPTDVELAYGQELNIDWRRSIDWIILNGDVVRNIALYGEYIFISNVQYDNSWADADVVSGILEHLGAVVCVTGEFHLGDFQAIITCKIAENVDVNMLLDTFNAYFEGKSPLIPWINFWTGRHQNVESSSHSDFSELQSIYLQREQARRDFDERNASKLEEFRQALLAASQAEDEVTYQKIKRENAEFLAAFENTLPELSSENWYNVHYASWQLEAAGKAYFEDGLLKIDLLWIEKIDQSVPAIIKLLESNGCTSIDCEVHYVMK